VALLKKRRYLNNHSGDFPQVILIVPSHVPNRRKQDKVGIKTTRIVRGFFVILKYFIQHCLKGQ
jgi:hypothetical protein